MAKVFKSPIAQAQSLQIPEFNLDAIRDYFTQYGDFMTDDAYEEWALKKGKKLGPIQKDALGTTRFPDYINDEEYLRDAWNEIYPEVLEYQEYLKSNPKERETLNRTWGR